MTAAVSLTDAERKVMAVLRRHAPLSAANVGGEVWGAKRHNGSCPYARTAGRVLKRLAARALVRIVRRDDHPGTRWELSTWGLTVLLRAEGAA